MAHVMIRQWRRTIGGTVLALSSAAGSLGAQRIAAVGVLPPIGITADDYKAGYVASLGFGSKGLTSPIGVRFEAGYGRVESRVRAGTEREIAHLASSLTLSGLGNVYMLAGLGAYHRQCLGSGCAGGSGARLDVGLNAGLGTAVALLGLSTLLEARLLTIVASGAAMKFIPVTLGLAF
jgi:hypothetical protein